MRQHDESHKALVLALITTVCLVASISIFAVGHIVGESTAERRLEIRKEQISELAHQLRRKTEEANSLAKKLSECPI